MQEPCQRDLSRRGLVRCCGEFQDAARSIQFALFHREPWDEAEVVLFAELQDRFVGAVGDDGFILDADDGDRFGRARFL